jgi:integrase/recombinase XerD
VPEENLYRRGEIYWLRATVRGHECRESLRTDNLRTARRLRDARIKEIQAARWHGEETRSWPETVVAWLQHERGQLAPATLKRYVVSLMQCEPYVLDLDIDKIDGSVIQSLVQDRRRTGAKPATVRRDLTAISRVLEYAEAMGWREGNPTLSKRRLLKERRDPIALPTEAAITAMVEGDRRRSSAP